MVTYTNYVVSKDITQSFQWRNAINYNVNIWIYGNIYRATEIKSFYDLINNNAVKIEMRRLMALVDKD